MDCKKKKIFKKGVKQKLLKKQIFKQMIKKHIDLHGGRWSKTWDRFLWINPPAIKKKKNAVSDSFRKWQCTKIHRAIWRHEYNALYYNIHEVSHLVNLGDHSVHHFPLKWAENNGLVLDWIEDKASPGLDHTCPDVVNGGDSNHKAIPGGRNANRWLVWAVRSSSLCQWRESFGSVLVKIWLFCCLIMC